MPPQPVAANNEAAPGGHGSGVLTGVVLALVTITIWVGWFISTRFLVTTGLAAEDVAALRFGVSGLLLLPFALRDRVAIARMGLPRFAILSVGAGAPYVLTIAAGLSFAPAAHAAALTPGVMPLFVALLSAFLLKERISASRTGGFILILAGVLGIAAAGLQAGPADEWKGHLLFLSGAFMWACYTLALRGSGLGALPAAAVVSVTSLVLYIPIYAMTGGARLLNAPADDVIFAAFYQGVLTGALSLVTYAAALERLGPSRAAAFASLIPVLTLLAAIPLLGEVPHGLDLIGIAAVSAGVYLATGLNGAWPRRR